MESREQAAGEKRVMERLIQPLLRRGLMKPGGMTKAAFEDMQADIAKKLAYMTDLNLGALEEVAAAMPGGKGRDRFPIANNILAEAARIQPPAESSSPLMLSVFRNDLGRSALDGGWAPELLGWLRTNRKWPGAYSVSRIRDGAEEACRHLRALERRIAEGGTLSPTEERWRDERKAVIRRCEAMTEIREGEAA